MSWSMPEGRRIRAVASFEELVTTPFAGDVNALCWPRRLPGDFAELVDRLPVGEGITTIADDDLRALDLGPAGAIARDVVLADLKMTRDRGLDPSLDCVAAHPRPPAPGVFPTDAYSFHADRAPVLVDTYLCTYIGPSSEGLSNEAAIRRADVPDTRAELLAAYGGPDGADFEVWLAEHSYDLHYTALAGAQPFTFGIGNLWRIAIACPQSHVAPCVHRAPLALPGTPTRLLLIC